MIRLQFRPHHQAVRDTMWVGKGVHQGWMLIVGILVVAGFLAYWLH